MAQSSEDSAEKEHEPSPRRLEEARKKGDVAKSVDLMAAAAYFGLLVAVLGGVPLILSAAGAGRSFLDHAPALARDSGTSLSAHVGGLMIAALLPVFTLLLVPGLASLATVIAQRGLVFAPSKLRPKMSRLSPIATAKQKFGPEGLFDFTKNALKLLLVSAILAIFLGRHIDKVIAAAALDVGPGILFLLGLLGQFLLISALLNGVIGIADFLWQRHSLLQRNRMSRQELLDEMKDSDGDPQAKATRKQRGQDIAMNQMLADVATANVVIVNPTHFAVALRWRRGDLSAPVLVAKGIDEIALRIRSEAVRVGVPIHSDPPTARAIHAAIKLGQPIDRAHYKAVAAAIRFADRMRLRRKGAGI